MDARQSRRKLILISQGAMLLLALLLYLIFRKGKLGTDLWDGRYALSVIVYTGLLAGMGIRFFSMSLGEVWTHFQDNMEDTVIRVLQDIDLLDLLMISILPAIVEELFFRGFMQPFLGLWLTAFIFSLLHWGGVRALWAHGLHAFLIGLFLGWLYLVTGSLLTTMVAHFVNNLLAGLYIQKKISF